MSILVMYIQAHENKRAVAECHDLQRCISTTEVCSVSLYGLMFFNGK